MSERHKVSVFVKRINLYDLPNTYPALLAYLAVAVEGVPPEALGSVKVDSYHDDEIAYLELTYRRDETDAEMNACIAADTAMREQCAREQIARERAIYDALKRKFG